MPILQSRGIGTADGKEREGKSVTEILLLSIYNRENNKGNKCAN